MPGPIVNIKNAATGEVHALPESDAREIVASQPSTWSIETPLETASALTAAQVKSDYSGPLDKGAAFVGKGLSALTLGATDVGARFIAGDEAAETYRNQLAANPEFAGAGEITGGLAGALASGGTSMFARAPAALTTRLGAALARSAPEAGALTKLGRTVVGGAVDAGLQNVGTGISDLAMADDPVSIERAAGLLSSRFISGAEFGGAASGALGLLEHGLSTAGRRLKAAREGADVAAVSAADIPADVAALDRAGVKAAREAELARIEATRVPERAQLVEDLRGFREKTKVDRPWDAVATGSKETRAAAAKAARRAAKAADAAEAELAALERAGAPPPPRAGAPAGALADPSGAPALTWREFNSGERMKAAMAETGSMPAAHKKVGADWQAYKASLRPGAGGPAVVGDVVAAVKAAPAALDAARAAAVDARRLADEAGAAYEAATAAVGAPRWMREAGKVYIEADKHIDRLMRNRAGLAEASTSGESARRSFRAALQEQRQALEEIQAKASDLRVVHATDRTGRRAASMATIPDTIAANRALQDRIEAIAAKPASPRLAALDSHDLMLQAPKPDPTIGQRILGGTAFGWAAGLARNVPLVGGVLAPIAGAGAADLVAGRLGPALAGAHRKALERTERAVGAFLTGTRKAHRVAPKLAAVASTAILEGARFGPEQPDPAPPGGQKRRPLEVAYAARARELAAAVQLTPAGPKVRSGVRKAIAAKLAPLALTAPVTADRIESQKVKELLFAYAKMPRTTQLGMTSIPPDDLAMRSWARTVAAMEDPGGIEERLADGTITVEDAEVMRELYPARMAEVMGRIMAKLGTSRLSYEKRLDLSLLTGEPVDASMMPEMIQALQSDFVEEEGSEGGTEAPKPQPAMGSIARPQGTPAQERERRRV